MPSRTLITLIVVLAAVSGLGWAGWRYVQSHNDDCAACKRPIHGGHSRTVALLDGKPANYCCPSCPLSEHRQSGKPVEVVSLTDHLTGKTIRPEGSYIVQGSEVNPCTQHHGSHAVVGPDKRPLDTHFDRCAPSMLAFASRADAARFAAEHGGRTIAFNDLAAQYR